MRKLFTSRYWKGFQDGHAEGVIIGFKTARHCLLKDLQRIGSTGDNFEAKWEDIYKLFPAETIEKIQAKDVYF